jgi:hypothetical protein
MMVDLFNGRDLIVVIIFLIFLVPFHEFGHWLVAKHFAPDSHPRLVSWTAKHERYKEFVVGVRPDYLPMQYWTRFMFGGSWMQAIYTSVFIAGAIIFRRWLLALCFVLMLFMLLYAINPFSLNPPYDFQVIYNDCGD